jgi:hypothetical protein
MTLNLSRIPPIFCSNSVLILIGQFNGWYSVNSGNVISVYSGEDSDWSSNVPGIHKRLNPHFGKVTKYQFVTFGK